MAATMGCSHMPFIARPVYQRVNDVFEHDPVRDTTTVTAQRVVGVELAAVRK